MTATDRLPLSFAVLLLSSPLGAKPKGPALTVTLVPHPEAAKLVKAMASPEFGGRDKIEAFGQTYPASRFCLADALANADSDIAVLAIEGRADALVVHCAAEVDGEKNTVAVFFSDRPPKMKKLAPPSGSSRITPAQLDKAVVGLLVTPGPSPR